MDWRKCWFVKPGLMGLAQVNDVTVAYPDEKLRQDLQYVKSQSFPYILKLLIRHLWMVGVDGYETFRHN